MSVSHDLSSVWFAFLKQKQLFAHVCAAKHCTCLVCRFNYVDGVVVSVLAAEPKGHGFEPGQGDGFCTPTSQNFCFSVVALCIN
jgi:hypothetical protein